MAVAVKTSPGAKTNGFLASPAILSLVGVVYLLACLAIVFKLLPDLWWGAWEKIGLVGSDGQLLYTFVGGSLLAVLALVVGVLLLVVGARLLGPNPPVGVRAGVFVGFLGLLAVVLLTRWVSLWVEHWTFYRGMFGENPQSTGLLVLAAVGVVLLLGWVHLFTRPRTQQLIVQFEQAGWFHATAYKGNQGQKVRRGTIVGLLVLVGAGIYTMVTHNVLGQGSPDLVLHLPFTGVVAVESYGDVQPFIASDLPGEAKSQVQVRWPGLDSTRLRTGQTISFEEYRKQVEPLLEAQEAPAEVLAQVRNNQVEPSAFLLAINRQVLGAAMEKLLAENYYPEGVTRRLENRFQQTPWGDLGDIVPDFVREADAVVRADRSQKVPAVFAVPSAVLLLDRYTLRQVNRNTSEDHFVKVKLAGDSDFKEGAVVSASDFQKVVDTLEKERSEGRDRTLPEKEPLRPATGPVEFAGITLLPSMQFTVPLLLLALSLWLAWRVVNMPTFADFLIATEAELNKVSWTTQKKLVQDTIVVLVTVLLMAVFLFGMDWTWKVVLSNDYVKVLYIPPEQELENKSSEQKNW